MIKNNFSIKYNINLKVFSQEAKNIAPLGPFLGQSNIKAQDFCDHFNEHTKFLEKSLPVIVNLWVLNKNMFDYIIKPLSISFLAIQCTEFSDEGYLTILDFYKIFLIRVYQEDKFSQDLVKTMLATLQSAQLIIRDINE